MKKISEYDFGPDGLRCYYYTASVENAIDILEHSHLYGSFPSKVNDPDDLRIEVEGLDANKFLGTNEEFQLMLNSTLGKKKLLDRAYRFVCFAKADSVDGDRNSALRFWNEYARGFKGVRFEFVLSKEFFTMPSAEKCLCDDMSYDGRIAKLNASRVRSFVDLNEALSNQDFLQALCYSKTPKWASEYEFRVGSVYRHLKNEMSRITSREERFFTFDLSKMKSVEVGCLADSVDIARLKLQMQKVGVELHVVSAALDVKVVK